MPPKVSETVGSQRAEGGKKNGMELLTGLEPVTSSLPRRCSTTELQQRGSGKKRMERVMGIEPTWPAWKAGALPLSYTREQAWTWWGEEDSNLRRRSQRIYNPSRLATPESPREALKLQAATRDEKEQPSRAPEAQETPGNGASEGT